MTGLAAAWAGRAPERERTSALVVLLTIAVLVPAWSVLDFHLERRHAVEFLALRATVAVSALIGWLWVYSRRAALWRNRIVLAVELVATGACVSYFVNQVEHAAAYSIGFSVMFWALGLIAVWPWHHHVATYVVWLTTHLVLWAELSPLDRNIFLGYLAYLVTAACLSVASSIVRARLEYAGFVASHQLERKNVELESALAKLTETRERWGALEKLTALGRLTAQLAHEINNPVNVIKNNLPPLRESMQQLDEALELARRADRSGSELDALWKKYDVDFIRHDVVDALSTVATACDRILTVQRDLRAFMRGDAEQQVESDLNEAVRATVALLRRNLGPRVVLTERYAELPRVPLFPAKVGQVTLNLLQNALDAVGDSGTIDVETRRDGDHLVLAVTDSGRGVSEQARKRLFEPFFTTKDAKKGTGIGLATCFQLVNLHGGTIELDEAYSLGARFVVSLPVSPRPGAGPAPSSPRPLSR